jgi:hypothetical protein
MCDAEGAMRVVSVLSPFFFFIKKRARIRPIIDRCFMWVFVVVGGLYTFYAKKMAREVQDLRRQG